MFGQRVEIEVLASGYRGGLVAAGGEFGFSQVASGFPARSSFYAAGAREAARSVRPAPGGR
jgi:hypothetical protein